MAVLPPELVEEIVTRIPHDCLPLLKNLENDVWNATVDEHLEKRRTIRFYFGHYYLSDEAPRREIFYAEKRLSNPTETFPFDRTSLFHSSMKRFTSLEACVFRGHNCRGYIAKKLKHYHLSEATEDDLHLAFRIFPVSSQRVRAPVPRRFSALQIFHYSPMLSYEQWEMIPNTFQYVHIELNVELLGLKFAPSYVDDFVERVRQSGRNVAMFIQLYDECANHFSPRRRRSLVDVFLQPQSEYLGISAWGENYFFELEDFRRIAEFWSTNDGCS